MGPDSEELTPSLVPGGRLPVLEQNLCRETCLHLCLPLPCFSEEQAQLCPEGSLGDLHTWDNWFPLSA